MFELYIQLCEMVRQAKEDAKGKGKGVQTQQSSNGTRSHRHDLPRNKSAAMALAAKSLLSALRSGNVPKPLMKLLQVLPSYPSAWATAPSTPGWDSGV